MIDDYDNYVLFLKKNGILDPQGHKVNGEFGNFYECLKCGRTRIAKITLNSCPFCDSDKLKKWDNYEMAFKRWLKSPKKS